MEHTYTRITSQEERRAPDGKYRVILNDQGDNPALYFVSDHDNAEEAIKIAETLNGRNQNGIVQNSKDWIIYPWFDGHQLHTREELLSTYGYHHKKHSTPPLTIINAIEIEARQTERIPGWKPGDRLVVFWSDIAEATGAKAYPGDF